MQKAIDIDVAITPRELAEAFCEMGAGEQSEFFASIWMIAKACPGAGWCQQSCSIAMCKDNDAIQAIRTLASHLSKEDVAWIVSASEEV